MHYSLHIPPFSNYVVLTRHEEGRAEDHRMIRTQKQCNRLMEIINGTYDRGKPEQTRNDVWNLARHSVEMLPNVRDRFYDLEEFFE